MSELARELVYIVLYGLIGILASLVSIRRCPDLHKGNPGSAFAWVIMWPLLVVAFGIAAFGRLSDRLVRWYALDDDGEPTRVSREW